MPNRSERLSVKLTNFEKTIIQKEAEHEGLCVAHLIRKIVRKYIIDNDSPNKAEMMGAKNAFFWMEMRR